MKKLIVYLLITFCMMGLFSSCGKGAENSTYSDDSKIVEKGDNFEIMEEYGSEELDSGYSFDVHGFNGIKNIYALNAKADSTVSVTYDLKTEMGKFKCVYVDTNNTIKVIVEKSGSGNLTLNVPKGESTIKIVGSYAKAHLTFNVQNSDGNVAIEYIN